MTERTLTLRIITPRTVVLETEAGSLRFPGEDGLFGVLPRHAAMVARTDSGTLSATTPAGESIERVIHDGFAEVRQGVVTILTRSAEKPEEIDLDRAKAAAERARERLRARNSDVDHIRALGALKRSLARQKMSSRA
ncbi:MAG: ATP synthase F1 subunit epsilon [Planctomycetota bacterium]